MKRALLPHVESGSVPGLVALVSHKGDTHAGALGSTAYEAGDVRRDGIFRILSMSKPVTAAAAMTLVDDEKLELEDPVDRYLPEFSDRMVLKRADGPLGETVPAKRAMTVRDLLVFTMGIGIVFVPPGAFPIQRAMDELRLGQGAPAPSVPPEPDEWIRRLGTLPLLHQPGEWWMYNTGADVLGVLIRRVAGMPFEVFLKRLIFEPLGMNDVDFVPRSKIDVFVDSYWTNPSTGKTELYDPASTGSGTGPLSSLLEPPAWPRARMTSSPSVR